MSKYNLSESTIYDTIQRKIAEIESVRKTGKRNAPTVEGEELIVRTAKEFADNRIFLSRRHLIKIEVELVSSFPERHIRKSL